MTRPQFYLRDLFWLMLAVAVGAGVYGWRDQDVLAALAQAKQAYSEATEYAHRLTDEQRRVESLRESLKRQGDMLAKATAMDVMRSEQEQAGVSAIAKLFFERLKAMPGTAEQKKQRQEYIKELAEFMAEPTPPTVQKLIETYSADLPHEWWDKLAPGVLVGIIEEKGTKWRVVFVPQGKLPKDQQATLEKFYVEHADKNATAAVWTKGATP